MKSTPFLLFTTSAIMLFLGTTTLVFSNANAYKVTSTSCSDGYDDGYSDFSNYGQVNSKFTEHTEVYQNCYLDGWMDSCLSYGNSKDVCYEQEDSQF